VSLLTGSDDADTTATAEAPVTKVGRTLSRANVNESKAIHDAAATMLEREGHRDHKDARTYDGDPDDEFQMSGHYEEKLLSKQAVPMVDDALILYPDEGQAEAAAAALGLGEEAHAHDVEGAGEAFMPGADMAAYEDAVADLAQGGHDDETENSTETTAAESAVDDDTEAMSNENTDTTDDTEKSDEPPAWADDLTEKVEQIDKRVAEIEGDAEKSLDDAPEWAQDLAAKVDDIDDRVDKVAKGGATTDQVEGGDESTDAETTDDVSAFKAALGGD